MMMKKKKKDGAATPSLKDCANCGAPEGKVYGVTVHRPCSKCGITYYCSVICQKHHWKEGGHKKHCVAKEERSASAAATSAAEEEDDGGGAGAIGGGGSAKPQKERDKDNECAICLEDLDDPEFGPAQILDCTHRFHRACVEELRSRGVQQTCPMCRAKLPDSAQKMFDDAVTIYFPIETRMRQSDESRDPLSRREQRQMDEVVRLWEGAAEQGHADAQYNLGVMYDHGRGCLLYTSPSPRDTIRSRMPSSA